MAHEGKIFAGISLGLLALAFFKSRESLPPAFGDPGMDPGLEITGAAEPTEEPIQGEDQITSNLLPIIGIL